MAKSFGRLPSEVLRLDPADFGDWELYQLDSAVLTFGRQVDNALIENANKPKKKRKDPAAILSKLLRPQGESRANGSLAAKAKTVKLEPGQDPVKALLES